MSASGSILTIRGASRQRHWVAEMLLFGGYSTASLADELRVSHEWLELFQIKMTGATSH